MSTKTNQYLENEYNSIIPKANKNLRDNIIDDNMQDWYQQF